MLAFFVFVFLSLVPVILSILLIIKGIKNTSKIKYLSIIGFLYFIFFIIFVLLEKTGFIPLYIYPFGIILIISLGCGLNKIKNKSFFWIIFSYLILAQLIIPNYYPVQKRGIEKAKIYYCIDKYLKTKDKNTYFIATTGGRFIKEYYNNEKIINYDSEKLKGSFKKNMVELIFNKKLNSKTIKNEIKEDILSNKESSNFKKHFDKTINNKLKINDKIILSFYADEYPILLTQSEIKDAYLKKYYPHLSKATLSSLTNDEIIFDKGYLSEIILTYSFNQLITQLEKNYKRIKIEQYQRTNNDNYIKTFETYNFEKNTQWLAENMIRGWVFITYQKIK